MGAHQHDGEFSQKKRQGLRDILCPIDTLHHRNWVHPRVRVHRKALLIKERFPLGIDLRSKRELVHLCILLLIFLKLIPILSLAVFRRLARAVGLTKGKHRASPLPDPLRMELSSLGL